ncbi:MAG TPA: hypothetical protein VFI56_24495, partial [Vicinamibacterales bacterium]|nr:hypothetical protein [Vicinamibacterales bacterium]
PRMPTDLIDVATHDPENAPPLRIENSFKSSTFAVTASAALAYVSGFVVVNDSMRAVGGAGFEFLNVRYWAAATLFWVLSGLPLAGGMVFWVEFASLKKAAGTQLSKARTSFFVTILLPYLLWQGLIYLLTSDVDVDHLRFPNWYFLLAFVSGMYARYTTKIGWPAIAHWDVSFLFRATAILMMFLASLAVFGELIYPRINPVFGGGAAWSGWVEASAPPARDLQKGFTAAILDQSNGTYRLMVCTGSRVQAFAIPATIITSFRLTSFIHPSAFTEWCRTHEDKAVSP